MRFPAFFQHDRAAPTRPRQAPRHLPQRDGQSAGPAGAAGVIDGSAAATAASLGGAPQIRRAAPSSRERPTIVRPASGRVPSPTVPISAAAPVARSIA
jgi:hypothetical protein